MASPRTKVFLTVDVECSEERLINGRIRRPLGYDELIWGRLNSTHELGIPMLVDMLQRRQFAATFFVETLCTRHFGEEGLAEVVQFLDRAGQDVQLHVHPNFERPEWRQSKMPAPDDNIGKLPLAVQQRLLTEGLAILNRCGAIGVTAFRAGNFGASNNTLALLNDLGFTVDASYNAFLLDSDCAIRVDGVPNDLFMHPAGIWELPISNVTQPGGGFRHLEVTALSSNEMRWSLEALAAAGVRHVTVLTHPDELFTIDSIDPPRGHVNGINVKRFSSLLDFLASYPDRFEVTTVGALASTLDDAVVSPMRSGPHPQIGVNLWLRRQVEQIVKRLDLSRRSRGTFLRRSEPSL